MDVEATFNKLYREIIVQQSQSQDMRGSVDNANMVAKGCNPYCGDDIRMEMRVENNVIKEARFTGEGCALAMSSTSIFAKMLHNMTLEDTRALISDFKRFANGERNGIDVKALKDLVAFEEVLRFPIRVKCVIMAFLAVDDAIKKFKENGV